MPRPPKNGLALNDRTVKGLKPGARRRDYMDLVDRGFGVFVQPSGAKTFFVRYRVRGTRVERRVTLGKYPQLTLASARSLAKGLLGRAAGGEDPQRERIEERAAPTFAELAESYLENAKRRLRPGSYRKVEQAVRLDLVPAWRHQGAARIRRRDVAELLDRIVNRGAPVQANRTRAIAHRLFAFAVEREIVEYNPVAGVRPPTQERHRTRVLSADEIRKLWAVWEDEGTTTSALFRMLLLTAQRIGEMFTLRWSDIDGDWWTILAGVAKNKKEHRVYLSMESRAVLDELRSTGSPWVFPSPRSRTRIVSVTTAVKRYRRLSGIPDWHPHDLRRTAASCMGDLEVPDAIISLVLNHAVAGVTARYSRSRREGEIARSLGQWGARLSEIVHGRGAEGGEVLRFAPADRAPR
jgi:integrase